MLFNPENKRYFEISTDERSKFLQYNGDYKRIFAARIKEYGTVEPPHGFIKNPAIKL